MSIRVSQKAARFTESVIREMSRVCRLHGGVNLAQGFPDFAAPLPMKDAARAAIAADVNQYAVTWGAPRLREAIARRTSAYNGIPVDPDRDVTVTCGATEAMVAVMLALLDPNDEVVVFEPFYENYGPDCILAGALPRFVRLSPPDWTFDERELERAIGPRTRAIVVNTPHNPTGKVFSRAELESIAALCLRHDLVAITDEIYEYILYDGAEHVSLATLPGMAERTVTISGLSKTWSATGWRIGWSVAPPALTGAIRKVHDFLTVGAPAPLQEAAADALAFGPEYFTGLARDYATRRAAMLATLAECGFEAHAPRGAYYVMANFRALSQLDDTAFAMELVQGGGVATVPGSSFFRERADGRDWVRFCFAKKLETLAAARAVLVARLGAAHR
jgi:aminotransferase